MDEMRILSPTAILGYGFPMESFEEGMKRKPHIIAVDAGSTDPGPYYLGAGISFTDRNAVKRDLAIMLPAALKANIPLVIGSAGGCGADSHLNWNVDIIKEIATEQGLHFKMAVISAEIKHETVKAKLLRARFILCTPYRKLTLRMWMSPFALLLRWGRSHLSRLWTRELKSSSPGAPMTPPVLCLPCDKRRSGCRFGHSCWQNIGVRRHRRNARKRERLYVGYPAPG
jgi:hypothetical protein